MDLFLQSQLQTPLHHQNSDETLTHTIPIVTLHKAECKFKPSSAALKSAKKKKVESYILNTAE